MKNKRNKNIVKAVFITLAAVSIIMYALGIIYSNKAHEIFVLMNQGNINELNYFHSLSNTLFSVHIVCIQALVFPIFYLNTKNKIRGWVYLNAIGILIFACCYMLDVISGNFYFKPSGDILQFAAILIGTYVIYFVLSIFYIFRNRKEKTADN